MMTVNRPDAIGSLPLVLRMQVARRWTGTQACYTCEVRVVDTARTIGTYIFVYPILISARALITHIRILHEAYRLNTVSSTMAVFVSFAVRP